MATFQSSGVMENRYSYLLKPGARYDSDDEDNNRESQEYAAFLRDKERKVARDGFVDSQQMQQNYTTSSKRQDGKGGNKEKKDKPQRMTVVDLLAKKEKDKHDYDRRLKIIEDNMYMHKQEERELKRAEGDIIKNQQTLRRSLRDYENAITRKRLAEEKKQNQQLQVFADYQREHQHKKEDQTKQRIEATMSSEQAHKDQARKSQLTQSHLAKKYHDKKTQLELMRTDVSRLTEEFESQLRKKEEEQFKLKQELAELSISLNMEAQKNRTMEVNYDKEKKKKQHQKLEEEQKSQQSLDAKQHQGEQKAKEAEQGRRKLSADLSLTRSHLQLKQREEQRHRKDTDNRLRESILVQKQLHEAAVHAEADHKNKQIDQKIQEHNQRRHLLATQAQRQKKENSVQHDQQFTQKFQKRFAEQQRREHEDHLKHFQKSVTKGEEVEYNLYNTVKNSEYNRQKKEQSVRHTMYDLQELKRQNAQKIKSEMLEAARKEEELKQKLAREQAMLAKVHATREESYMMLQKHRQQLRDDRRLLSEHEREHQRLMRVGQKSEAMSA